MTDLQHLKAMGTLLMDAAITSDPDKARALLDEAREHRIAIRDNRLEYVALCAFIAETESLNDRTRAA